jgi:hypothetical protein
MEYSHTCSCGKTYKDNDPEVYFCSDCVAQRKAIAAEVDKKMANRSRKQPQSDFQTLLEKGQSKGEATFVRASDLGIRF